MIGSRKKRGKSSDLENQLSMLETQNNVIIFLTSIVFFFNIKRQIIFLIYHYEIVSKS